MHQNVQCYSPKILYSADPSQVKGSHRTAKIVEKRIETQSGSLNPQPSFSLLILKELHESPLKQLSTDKDLREDGEMVGLF